MYNLPWMVELNDVASSNEAYTDYIVCFSLC